MRALHGHVLPCKQHIVFKRETFRFLAFIYLFLTLSRSGENDDSLFAGRNYFHISSFIYSLISANIITIRINYPHRVFVMLSVIIIALLLTWLQLKRTFILAEFFII